METGRWQQYGMRFGIGKKTAHAVLKAPLQDDRCVRITIAQAKQKNRRSFLERKNYFQSGRCIPNMVRNLVFDCVGIPIFEVACITQLIQVGLQRPAPKTVRFRGPQGLRRRFASSNMWRRLCQIPKF